MISGALATSQVSVTSLRPEHEDAYERFVASHPHALVSYTRQYRDLLCDLLACRPLYAVAIRRDRIVGVLPLMEKDGPYGRVLNSLPYFGSNGGPLSTDAEADGALVAWYEQQIRAPTVAAATLIDNPLALPAEPSDHNFVDIRTAHVTTLPPEAREADLFQTVDESRRRNVRKAKRLGTRVEVENDNLSTLEELHKQSMEAIGADVKSPAFFAALPRHFSAGTDYEIFVARVDAAAVAALLLFYTSRAVDYYMPAVSPAARSGQPLALVLATAMLHAAERGHTCWNWGGSPAKNLTLQRFKAKWGGIPREYRYWTEVKEKALLSATPDGLQRAYPGFYVVPYDQLPAREVPR